MPLTRRRLAVIGSVLLLSVAGIAAVLVPAVHRARVSAQRTSDL
jgi:hypothetical protein